LTAGLALDFAVRAVGMGLLFEGRPGAVGLSKFLGHDVIAGVAQR
jgi:hypothetical protein